MLSHGVIALLKRCANAVNQNLEMWAEYVLFPLPLHVPSDLNLISNNDQKQPVFFSKVTILINDDPTNPSSTLS